MVEKLRALPPCAAVVCYGIGNFSELPAARYQVALAFLLREEVQHLDFLKECRCMTDVPNEEGRRSVLQRTLFFMPHCGRQLYANLLSANWVCASLGKLVVLGNSFNAYAAALSNAQRERAIRWCHLVHATPWVTEQPCGLPAGHGSFANAFNSLSLHCFATPRLPDESDTCWDSLLVPPPADDPLTRLDIITARHAHRMVTDEKARHVHTPHPGWQGTPIEFGLKLIDIV